MRRRAGWLIAPKTPGSLSIVPRIRKTMLTRQAQAKTSMISKVFRRRVQRGMCLRPMPLVYVPDIEAVPLGFGASARAADLRDSGVRRGPARVFCQPASRTE
jgi:hypothetical protein